MSKGRVKSNIKFNYDELEKDIKKIEGDKFQYARIDKFVLGKSIGYFRLCKKNGEISLDGLNRICEFYDLDKEDYIEKAVEPKKEELIKRDVETQNYENLITLLTALNKTMIELLTQQKTTNFLLNELKTSAMNDNKFNKEISEKLDLLNGKGKPYYKR